MSIPKFDDLPIKPGYPQHSAWGVWGDSDELGTLNHLTKDRVLEARSEIQLGERITINWPMNLPSFPAFGRQAFEHRIISKHPRPVHDDVLHFNTQSGSQWDGLRHYGFKEHKLFYNGVTPEEIREGRSLRNGIHGKLMAEAGIAGRGVLLDYYAYVQRHKITFDPLDTYAISIDNLEACRREQGTEFKPGDILLIRVGYTDALGKNSHEEQKEVATRQPVRFAGVECKMDVIRWIWEKQFAAVAGDSPSWEVQPMGDWSLHEVSENYLSLVS
ncbi:MAG: hypothetical protein TREMPRED_003382 [Tremellales sp. Tagirdzhanova-0007]|nr:MAG: hypothetical protein TREMPRED_003382 [Tremellales sp. Tagirdzhanova-0007]